MPRARLRRLRGPAQETSRIRAPICIEEKSAGEAGMAMTEVRTGAIGQANHHVVPAIAETVHWGYFSRSLKPVLSVESGDFVTIEALTHHAYDDHARMILGDPGAESVFLWTKDAKNVDRRGAGPMDASIHGRGPARGSGCISAPARSWCRVPSRATSSRCG
jgi:hypothetical protein